MTTMNDVNLDKGTVNIAEYSNTEAALAELKQKYSIVPDANTAEGYALVKSGIKELTSLRTAIEEARKRVKEPYLQAGRIIDAEAKRITADLVALEDPMKLAKKEVDDRKERERQERIARLQVKVDAIKAMPGQVRGQSSTAISNMLDRVGEIDAEHDFYDLTKEAVAARHAALEELAQMLTDRLAFEAAEEERKKLEAHNAELLRQQQEQQAELRRQQDELERQQRELQEQREAMERERAALNPPAVPVAATQEPEPTAVIPPQPATRAKSQQDTCQWRAVVVDKSALIAAIAAGYGTEDLLIIDQAALDSLANDARQSLELAGVRAEPVPAAA